MEGDPDEPAAEPNDEAGDLVHLLDEQPHLKKKVSNIHSTYAITFTNTSTPTNKQKMVNI